MKLTILVDPPSSLAEKKMEHLSHAGGNPQVVGINATDGQVQHELDGWLGLGIDHTHIKLPQVKLWHRYSFTDATR